MRISECYDMLTFINTGPAITISQTLQQSANAIGAFLGDWSVIGFVKRKLLVLGADAPLRLWFKTFGKIIDQLRTIFYDDAC